ncbi:hypothetical protein G8C41_01050 [Apibacter sp. B3706]|uniref:hypothetical protein n=1 Tax=Apibacter sp. B3706 TaxID=2656760 RepID=UPI00140AE674|nr:hypothetical protein [Apibacter sp. B3706]QII69463.1 hypothetical protein G8C41_01050 [Apibacter sp. B3706]
MINIIFDLYIYLNGPQKGYDLKRFRKEISTDPEYNKRVYKYIGGKKAGINYDAFAAATGLTDYLKRKKINSKKVINPMILITPLIKFMRQIMHMSKKVNQIKETKVKQVNSQRGEHIQYVFSNYGIIIYILVIVIGFTCKRLLLNNKINKKNQE